MEFQNQLRNSAILSTPLTISYIETMEKEIVKDAINAFYSGAGIQLMPQGL